MNANIKTWLVGGYFSIGFMVTVYLHFWGKQSYKPLAYHIGQGLVWPAVMFPSIGKLIGGIVIILVIVALTVFGSRSR